MVDAIRRLALEGPECCRFSRLITNASSIESHEEEDQEAEDAGGQAQSVPEETSYSSDLNQSQREAIKRTEHARVSLIWGPPGEDELCPFSQILY